MRRSLVVTSLAALASTAIATGIANEPASPLFEGGQRPLFIGPAPDATDCEPCHAAIAVEWRGSLHAASWTDPVFQAAYVAEPIEFCRNCHAPLHRPPEPSGAAAHDGISCAVCHVRDGEVLGTGTSPAPHAVRISPELGRSSYCAPCHEFGFLGRGVGDERRESREPQQATFSEWLASDSDAQCQDCHMPLVDGHRSHAFAASRDPALLARAVAIDVTAETHGERVVVNVRLVSNAVGHAFPTGDLNRRLELRAWLDTPPARPQLTWQRFYKERFEPGIGTTMYVEADIRAGIGPAERTFALNASHGQTIHWRLDYLLMSDTLATTLGVPSATNVTTLARGTVPITAPR